MANDVKKAYPSMPVRQWWALREQFLKTIPSAVTASYLAAALGMGEASAQNNILPSLKSTGLIDDDGKPTDLAVKWRDNAHYKEACGTIQKKVYPKELIDLGFDESTSKSEVQRWFANNARVGQNAASKMATFYIMLCEADPSKAVKLSPRSTKIDLKSQKTKSKSKQANKREEITKKISQNENGGKSAKIGSEIHLNIQIHISPESPAEQIDQIFSSIARHLKDLT